MGDRRGEQVMTYDNVIRLTDAAQTWALPRHDEALVCQMLKAYSDRRLGAQRHREKSVARDLRVIREFLAFCRTSPWRWTEQDFERWCCALAARKIAVSTQRHYQGAIRVFLQYLSENVKFQTDVRRQYGVSLTQICHADNCIPHVVERELARERPWFTHDEIDRLFDALDDAIAEAARFGGKDLRPLQRDKAMFFLIYVGALRVSETLGLNVGSFHPNPELPKLGQYGFITVSGKGSRGSGEKQRTVPVTHPSLPDALLWYIETVRPRFLAHANPNEQALFLSERGRRLSLSGLEDRFQRAMERAGLNGRGFSPHALRHTSNSHELYYLSGKARQRKLGHTFAATTQLYTHVPDEFVRREITKVVSAQLDTIHQEER